MSWLFISGNFFFLDTNLPQDAYTPVVKQSLYLPKIDYHAVDKRIY